MPLRAHISSISTYRTLRCTWRRRRILVALHLFSSAYVDDSLSISGGWGVSVPSLSPSVCPQNYVALEGHSGEFFPPGLTIPLRGYLCPSATRLPLPLPGDPSWGFPPLWRPRGPPLCIPPQRTFRPGFSAGQQPSPFPDFRPMLVPDSAASSSTAAASDVEPPLAAALPGPVYAPLLSGPSDVGVGVIPTRFFRRPETLSLS